MKINICYVLIVVLTTSCVNRANDAEKILIERINLVDITIQEIEKNGWKNTSNIMSKVPWIYYCDSISYILNPNEKFLNDHKVEKINIPDLKLYKYQNNDSQFHMETNVTRNDSSFYDYMSPFLNTSSFEITRNIIPDVPNVEEWITMLLHEKFHGYQFMHNEFLVAYGDITEMVSQDSLQNIYKSYPWYNSMLNKENEYLLKAIHSDSNLEARNAIDSFSIVRKKRRLKYKQIFSDDIEAVERAYELVEGSARYYDRAAQKVLSTLPTYRPLKEIDPFYNGVKPFSDSYEEENSWAYLPERSGKYFYATGYNIMRVLDKFGIANKEVLFKNPEIDLEKLLIEVGSISTK